MKKKFGFEKKDLADAARFVITLLVFFIAINFLASLIPLELIEFFVAQISFFFLGLLGFSYEILLQEPVLVLLETQAIQISYLCTGLLETIVLVSAVLASHGISWKKRIQGALAGIAVSLAFNVLRIDLTVLIVHGFGIAVAEFGHDFLFRLVLFLVVAGYYFAWFKWATEQ